MTQLLTDGSESQGQQALAIARDLLGRGTHTWEIPDLAERKQAVDAMFYTLGNIEMMKTDAREREFYGDEVWAYVLHMFAMESPSNEELLPALLRDEVRDEHRLRDLDLFLIENQVDRFGLLLLMSKRFQVRYLIWEQYDLGLLKRFLKAMERRAKKLQNEKGGWLNVGRKEIERASKKYQRDARLLFQRFRDQHRGKSRRPTNDDFVRFSEEQLRSHPEDYPAFSRDPRLGDQLRKQPNPFASQIVRRKVTPAQFIHDWMEQATGHRWSHLKDL